MAEGEERMEGAGDQELSPIIWMFGVQTVPYYLIKLPFTHYATFTGYQYVLCMTVSSFSLGGTVMQCARTLLRCLEGKKIKKSNRV